MRRGLNALLAVALAATLTACGSEDSSLPEAGSVAPATPTATGWNAAQQAVIEGFERYNQVLDEVSRGGKLDMAAVHKVAREPYATKAARKVDTTASAGVVLQGEGATFTPSSVEVDGTSATYRGCADYSGVRLVNTYADPPAEVPITPLRTQVTVTLALDGQSWLVTGLEAGAKCSGGAS